MELNIKKSIFFLFFNILYISCFSQLAKSKDLPIKGYITRAIVVDGDTFPVFDLYEAKIVEKMSFKTKKEEDDFKRLKRDVKRAYPYAVIASAKLKECNAALTKISSEHERKKYMKKVEKEIIQQFEKDMRKLTLNQGRILIKLIDRETGSTSYGLVKELRGSLSAFMWQSLAVFFGASLKSEYDPTGKDRMIEHVIALIQSGEI